MFFKSKKVAGQEPEKGDIRKNTKKPSAATGSGAPPKSAPGILSNGGVTSETSKRAAAIMRLSAAFAQIVTIFLSSTRHRQLPLADLEWLVFPALMNGQYSLAKGKAKDDRGVLPSAVVLWASVSREVDKKLSQTLAAPVKLRPEEWTSGDIFWVIEAVGDRRVLPTLLQQLSETTFKGRTVKMRTRGSDGKPTVRALTADTLAQRTTSGRPH